jgi:hypothetical protein
MPSITLQQITDCIQHALAPIFVFYSEWKLSPVVVVQLSGLFDSIVSKLAFLDQISWCQQTLSTFINHSGIQKEDWFVHP